MATGSRGIARRSARTSRKPCSTWTAGSPPTPPADRDRLAAYAHCRVLDTTPQAAWCLTVHHPLGGPPGPHPGARLPRPHRLAHPGRQHARRDRPQHLAPHHRHPPHPRHPPRRSGSTGGDGRAGGAGARHRHHYRPLPPHAPARAREIAAAAPAPRALATPPRRRRPPRHPLGPGSTPPPSTPAGHPPAPRSTDSPHRPRPPSRRERRRRTDVDPQWGVAHRGRVSVSDG
jgi:hypothetical protein